MAQAYSKVRPVVTVLVPAFNEEKNILKVLNKIQASPFVNEIICINDGSTDNTYQLIKEIRGIKVIHLAKNHGKSYAIATGIKKAKGEIIVFVDADIIGLSSSCLKQLVLPLFKHEADGVLGYPMQYKVDRFFKPLTGERAYFRSDLMPHLSELAQKGFGLELFLNYLYKDKRIKAVPIQGKNMMKHHKYSSYSQAIKGLIIENTDIIKEIFKQTKPLNYLKHSYLYPFYLQKKDQVKRRENFVRISIVGSLVIGMAIFTFPALVKARAPLYQNIKIGYQKMTTAIEQKVKDYPVLQESLMKSGTKVYRNLRP
ncbi:hypothetical protein A2631_02070 [Candidatus Daviesbacteria bacterium RIFCSPHIGHO2_01_FULL_44_29]|uniref:Glycosyltransferase 2-like domain-containing protein n=1 Tax=Candidatus Daviesbacteria bacterium RIFCSPHIGHO2_02_FULL_43_12 TaxID=1797776 RepID=A0A1F5KJT7_9BACT|nr:MAG: hypothetical protein A2631_02070 [Candidatus Daviesbacteria bacterium RIFCSPHIGHO2_01_FULL_44_29]OGE39541.1 MAG: hypothetical protein A3E86_01830 [Candidatus Daviesbacteria bacterium RIFCSPHIGHO2_12_FULL_47_45]OGE41183.1 MAG: hypothetical protein A3D25_01465 [Candidatus Daviesbacteria bacterium RIFCSPHIGHO2_02_FULL_43_12]OGE69382.1 MAG: hypothetical protein A3B55_03205 [Candidatus Daviesbacteria bacterium RIFCSPLOWO2_01_FULL_43_15]